MCQQLFNFWIDVVFGQPRRRHSPGITPIRKPRAHWRARARGHYQQGSPGHIQRHRLYREPQDTATTSGDEPTNNNQATSCPPESDSGCPPFDLSLITPLHFNVSSTFCNSTTETSQKTEILMNNFVIKNVLLFTFILIFYFATVNLIIKALKAHWEISKKWCFEKTIHVI